MIKDIVTALGFRRTALVASVALPLFASFNAQAQTAPAAPAPAAAAAPATNTGGTAEAERVVVTGSNIPTAEEVTAAPVDTLTPQEINRSGSQEILTVLQKRNPSFTGGGNLGSTNANIASGATLGGSIISIRGFPTLVLYEGRRIADSSAIASGGFQFTDVSLFPAALISRIEVLKDGASAIYGSEAVGGVVNIFTKDDFQGAEVGFRYGTALNEAVAERRGYAIAGVGNETTQITAGMQYYEIDPLFSRQVDYSRVVLPGSANYGGHVFDNAGPTQQDYIIIGETPGAPSFPGPIVANSPFNVGVVPGSLSAAGGFGQAPLSNFYTPVTRAPSLNLGSRPTSTLDTARTNVIASVNHQIFGKQLEVFGNFLYSNADFQSALNAQPLTNFSSDAAGNFVTIPAGRVGVPFGSPGYLPGVNNPIYNPFTTPIDNTDGLFVAQRYNSVSPRIFDNNNNFYRFLGGVRSQITPDWTGEAAAYYSKYDINFVNRNLVIATQLNKLLAGTAVDNNGNAIPALDFFAVNPIGTNPGQISLSQFNTIFGSNLRQNSSFQRVFDGKLTGFPFELPAGKVGVAVGAEFRQEGFKFTDSPEIFVASVPNENISVKRDIYSVYAEVSIPVASEKMHIPGVYSLDIDLAGRYDHYDGVSEDAKVPKVALRYQPIKDLTLRATYSNSFVAPTLFQTQGPLATGFSPSLTIGGQTGQAQVQSGSNRALVPSKADAYTAGLVYSPSVVPGLTITADYFHTLQQQIAGTLGGALILNSVQNFGPASTYASLVSLNNFPGRPGATAITAPGQVGNNFNRLFYIDNLKNLGASRAEGFDLSANYNIDLKTLGQLELGISSIVYINYSAKVLPKDSYYNVMGLDGAEGLGAIPDYKLTFLAEYRWQGLSASVIANYIPKLGNAVGRDPQHEDQKTFLQIQDYLEFDGRLAYTFERKGDMSSAAARVDSKDAKSVRDGNDKNPAPVAGATLTVLDRLLNGTSLAVGCNNIFDRTPPFVRSADSNTDLSVYDPYGRFLYFEIAKKF